MDKGPLPEGVVKGIEKYVQSQISEHVGTENEEGTYLINVISHNMGTTYTLLVFVNVDSRSIEETRHSQEDGEE